MFDEPLGDSVYVDRFFAGDHVAPNFSAFDGLEIHLVDENLHGESLKLISLVAEEQKRDAAQGGSGEQILQLALCNQNAIPIRNIHHIDDGKDSSTITLPHGSRFSLSTNIPKLYSDLPLVTFHVLKPAVGVMSSRYSPVAIALTRDVFPAF